MKRFLTLAFAVAALALCACSDKTRESDNNAGDQTDNTDNTGNENQYVGHWSLYKLVTETANGQTIASVNDYEGTGRRLIFEFLNDNSGSVITMHDEDGEWVEDEDGYDEFRAYTYYPQDDGTILFRTINGDISIRVEEFTPAEMTLKISVKGLLVQRFYLRRVE